MSREPGRGRARLVVVASALSAMATSRPVQDAEHVAVSFRDLAEDFDGLIRIATATRSRLREAGDELRRAHGHLHAAAAELMLDHLTASMERSSRWIDELADLRTHALGTRHAEMDLDRLARAKERLGHLLRAEQAVAASLIVATDWQSPSFEHAGLSAAGRHTGRVREHHDDYKRDRHPDADEFERAYLREYVDRPARVSVRAVMTSCGMSAFTTILGVLSLRGSLDRRPVVMGRSTYHECRDLIEEATAGRCVTVDETDTDGVLQTVARVRPRVVFLDSVCNAKGLAVPDLGSILERLCARPPGEELVIVIDNTGLSCAFQPWLRPRPTTLRLIVFESLTKYAQLGFDRTPAGIVVVEEGTLADGLSAFREHLGTNVSDWSAHAIPQPDRPVMERRLRRLERNALIVAEHLQSVAETLPILDGVTYPGLLRHPSYRVARSLPFRGGFLALELEPAHDRPDVHSAVLQSALREARRAGVSLVAGPSFGFDITRIYVTSTSNRAFVRIAPGAEHRLQVDRVALVLSEAMRQVAASLTVRRRAAPGRRAPSPPRLLGAARAAP